MQKHFVYNIGIYNMYIYHRYISYLWRDIVFFDSIKFNNMFNEKVFNLMKGKYLINVGRGNCIDEKALYNALKNNILYGAAIDTWKRKAKENGTYPCEQTAPLWELDNIIMSPHQALKINIGHERYVLDCTENVISYLLTGYERDKVNLKKGY